MRYAAGLRLSTLAAAASCWLTGADARAQSLGHSAIASSSPRSPIRLAADTDEQPLAAEPLFPTPPRPQSGHSTSAGPDAEGMPPRIAQYPLENDPYEGPPLSPQAPAYNDSHSPRTSSPAISPVPEAEPWIKLDSAQVYGAYLQKSNEGLGWTDAVGKATISFPHAKFIWISPQIGSHFISNSGFADVPSEVYDASLEVSVGAPLGDRWTVQGAISPGVFSDFRGEGGDVFRIPARALLFYKWSEELTLGAGYLYLDRKDINGLPLVGLSYIPSDHFRAELWFPRPKFSWKYLDRGDLERWFYVVGEFGGGSWAIQRDDGARDNFAYRDYRAMAGVEQKNPEGLGWFVEGGLIFGRRYSLSNADVTVDLKSTMAVQAGLRF
jgi:hypothetical protein